MNGKWHLRNMPERVTQEHKDAAEATLARIALYMEPISHDSLKVQVVSLLSHYYQRDLPEQLNRLMAQDWYRNLAQFPEWAVVQGRANWLDNNRKKPMPADIKAEVQAVLAKYTALKIMCERILETPIEKPEPTPEQREKNKAAIKKMMDDMKRKQAIVLDRQQRKEALRKAISAESSGVRWSYATTRAATHADHEARALQIFGRLERIAKKRKESETKHG